MASVVPAVPISSNIIDTAGQIDNVTTTTYAAQVSDAPQSAALVRSRIALAKPNLLKDADFDSISQSPDRERRQWASIYRSAHAAQRHQEEAWVRFAGYIGKEIDATSLKIKHAEYLHQIKSHTAAITGMNKEIAEKNRELKRGENYCQIVAMPFRGPQLERLDRGAIDDSDKGINAEGEDGPFDEEASQQHFQFISTHLTSTQRDLIAPKWSLAAALMLHRNDLLENPEYFDASTSDDITRILKKKDDDVKALFKKNSAFQGQASEIWKKHKNLGKIRIPTAETPAQRFYNARKDTVMIGSQYMEDEGSESEEEESDEDDDELQLIPGQRTAPPPDVQTVRAKLGGWNGLLTQYFNGQMEKPPRNLYSELIEGTDKAISELYTGADNGRKLYEYEYGIKKHLNIMSMGYQKVTNDITVRRIMKGNFVNSSISRKDEARLEGIAGELQSSIRDLQLLENFVDAIVPPEVKSLIDDGVTNQQDQSYKLNSSQLVAVTPNQTDVIMANNPSTGQTDVIMANNPSMGQTNVGMARNQSTTPGQYEITKRDYYNQIAGRGGRLWRYLYDPNPLQHDEAERKLDLLAEEFQDKCNAQGFDAKQDIIDKGKLAVFKSLSQKISNARTAYLAYCKEADLNDLEEHQRNADAYGDLGTVIRGDSTEFDERIEARKRERSNDHENQSNFRPLLANENSRVHNTDNPSSRFYTPSAWRSPPGMVMDNGSEKKIVGVRSVGNGEQLLLQWRNPGAERDAFELVASSFYKHKRNEYTGGKMEQGTKVELKTYALRDCALGGVAQVRRRDTTTSYIPAPATYISISHRGEEKWFTKSDMISVFGEQIKDEIEDYNRAAHQTLVEGDNGWKNSRSNGWKTPASETVPANDKPGQEDFNRFIQAHSAGHVAGNPTKRERELAAKLVEVERKYEELRQGSGEFFR